MRRGVKNKGKTAWRRHRRSRRRSRPLPHGDISLRRRRRNAGAPLPISRPCRRPRDPSGRRNARLRAAFLLWERIRHYRSSVSSQPGRCLGCRLLFCAWGYNHSARLSLPPIASALGDAWRDLTCAFQPSAQPARGHCRQADAGEFELSHARAGDLGRAKNAEMRHRVSGDL